MLSQTAEYALRAVVFLAQRAPESAPARKLAAELRVPPGYVAKILGQLARAGILRSQRGPGGGFCLGRPASQLSVLDVVEAVDPIRRVEGCPLGLAEHAQQLCPLHRALDQAAAELRGAFASTPIGSLLAGEGGAGERASCAFPAALEGAAPGGQAGRRRKARTRSRRASKAGRA